MLSIKSLLTIGIISLVIPLVNVSSANTIDSFWKQYSNGRFGFSVQKKIWLEDGGKSENWGDRVGWFVLNRWIWYREFNFSLLAPLGHLPAYSGPRGEGVMGTDAWVSTVFSRRESCHL